jgi:capsular polysaccharide biosynthesis protein
MKLPILNLQTKLIVLGCLIVLICVIVSIYFYRSANNAKTQAKIDVIEVEKKVTEEQTAQWKQKISDMNAEFVKSQKQLSNNAQEIRKNTKPTKLPNYGKVKINSASYNTMLDSLLIAQPD